MAPSKSSSAAVVPTQNSMLPSWMQQSLEHLGMRANVEDYSTSPPDCESFFLHDGKMPNYSTAQHHQTDGKSEAIVSLGGSYSSLVSRARDLAPPIPRATSADPEMMMGDRVCPSSAPTSAVATPSVTPQPSPTLMKRILSADISGARGTFSRAGSNLKGSASECARKARLVPVMRVTNFDLNAVSPTSW